MSRATRISVVLNLALLLVVAWQWRDRHRSARAEGSTAAPTRTAVAPSAGPVHPRGAVAAPAHPVEIGAGWQSWIEPLRAAKVPTDVLAGLVRADFDRRWQPRQAEMQQKYLGGTVDADALAAFAVEHDIESERDLAAALGADEFRRWDMDRVLKELPPAASALNDTERGNVYDVQRRLRDELRQAELDRLRGATDQATMEQRQQQARDAANAQLRTLLGSDRAAQLQGVDDTEGNLRRQLRGTAVSDTQLQALANAQRTFDQTRSDLVQRQTETEDPAYGKQAAEAEERFAAAFEQIAGARAFDEATQRADSRYNDLQKFAGEWKLSQTETQRIYQTIATVDTAVRQYQLDAATRGVDVDAQTNAVQALQRRTIAALTEKLGAERIALLQRNGILPTP